MHQDKAISSPCILSPLRCVHCASRSTSTHTQKQTHAPAQRKHSDPTARAKGRPLLAYGHQRFAAALLSACRWHCSTAEKDCALIPCKHITGCMGDTTFYAWTCVNRTAYSVYEHVGTPSCIHLKSEAPDEGIRFTSDWKTACYMLHELCLLCSEKLWRFSNVLYTVHTTWQFYSVTR